MRLVPGNTASPCRWSQQQKKDVQKARSLSAQRWWVLMSSEDPTRRILWGAFRNIQSHLSARGPRAGIPGQHSFIFFHDKTWSQRPISWTWLKKSPPWVRWFFLFFFFLLFCVLFTTFPQRGENGSLKSLQLYLLSLSWSFPVTALACK